MDPIAHAESALADLGGTSRHRPVFGRPVFRVTFVVASGNPVTWLVEAQNMEDALKAVSEQMPQGLAAPWIVRTIEDLGRLMIRT
jgi:hypothetical protein